MKKLFISFILVLSVLFINSCGVDGIPSISSEIETEKSSEAILENSGDITTEASTDTSDVIADIVIECEPNINTSIVTDVFIERSAAINGFENLAFYSEYSEVKYVLSKNDNGESGTYALKDGKKTAFYPNAFNVCYYNGALYGITALESDEAFHGAYSYSLLHEDGTHEKLLECENVYYIGDKIYYYDIKQDGDDNDSSVCLYRANIDGTDIEMVADDIYDWPVQPKVIKYDDYVFFTEFNGGISVVAPSGEKASLVDDATTMRRLHIVNDGFVYYSECTYTYGLSGKLDATHTLWRVRVDGTDRERLLTKKTNSFEFDVAVYNERFILFTSDTIYSFDGNLNIIKTYDFDKLEATADIGQIIIKNGNVVFAMSVRSDNKLQYVVYNSDGEIVFEY